MRLAYKIVSMVSRVGLDSKTYVFDVWARVDGDNITVLHPQVVANNPIYPC
jgi:hypothetical protein